MISDFVYGHIGIFKQIYRKVQSFFHDIFFRSCAGSLLKNYSVMIRAVPAGRSKVVNFERSGEIFVYISDGITQQIIDIHFFLFFAGAVAD